MPNPFLNESLFDAIFLGNKRSPGFVTLSGHDRNQKWDIKEPDGHGGATTTWKGETVTQFSASFYLVYDPVQGFDEFADWDAFAAHIRSMLPKTGKPRAMDIYHPDLARNDIKSVQQASIGGLTHDGKGGATVVVKFLEWRPPKKKPANATPAGSTTKPVDPNADVKAELAALLVQAKQP